jgi:conjugal transfer/type IV secretion protein DotA/TraY
MILRFTLILMLFVSNVVWAQGNPLPSTGPLDSLTINPTDVSVTRLLSDLFGGLIPAEYASGGAGLNPLGEVIGIFNGILLVFAAVLLSYTLIAGTMQTAHDGEMLGKRWSSMWLPLRTSIGVAAMVPLPSGYCIIQYIVMWMVLQGIGAANLMWSTFATKVNSTAQMAMSHDYKATNDMAANTLRQMTCIAVVNGSIGKAKAAAQAEGRTYHGFEPIAPTMAGATSLPPSTGDMSGAAEIMNASNAEQEGLANSCGTYSISMPRNATANSSNQLAALFGGSEQLNQFSASMNSAHMRAHTTLQAEMQAIAQGLYEKKETDQGGITHQQAQTRYTAAVNSYNQKIQAAVNAGVANISQENEVTKNATRDGWALAGAFYMKLIKIQQAMADEIQRVPETTPPTGKLPTVFQAEVGPHLKDVEGILRKSRFTDTLGVLQQASDDINAGETGSTYQKWIKDSFAKGGLSDTKYLFDIGASKNIILALADAGHRLMNIAVTSNLTLAGFAALGDSKAAGFGLGVGAAIQVLQVLLLPIFGALLGAAAVLAFVIPMTPFIIWMGVILGWLIMVVEAIIAAPMWILAHLYPDGDGIVGQAGQGYSLVFALFLRPPLAILGLLFSMAIINPFGSLIVEAYWSVAAISNGQPGILTPIWYAASVVLFASLILGFINKAFGLIHVIPDQIFKWMGGPSGDLGQYAGDMARGSAGAAGAVGGVVGGVGSKGIEAGQNFRGLREQKKANELQNKANMDNRLASLQSQNRSNGEFKGATENAYQQVGLAHEGAGVAQAELKSKSAMSDKWSEASSQLQKDKGFQDMYKRGDEDGMAAAIEGRMLQNVNQASAANGGPQFSNLDSWSQSVKENEYASWHEKGNQNGQLEATAPTYNRAKELFQNSQEGKAKTVNGANPSANENPGG